MSSSKLVSLGTSAESVWKATNRPVPETTWVLVKRSPGCPSDDTDTSSVLGPATAAAEEAAAGATGLGWSAATPIAATTARALTAPARTSMATPPVRIDSPYGSVIASRGFLLAG